MKNTTYIVTIIITLISVSCNGNKKDAKIGLVKNEISQTWDNFLNVIESNNRKDFKELSNEKIKCYLCLENTNTEEKEIRILRENDSLWYNKIYDDLIYIAIDSFVKQDFDLIFNPEFVKILKENETKFHKRFIEGIEYYEILVSTTEPILGYEGGQYNFQFKKINGEWKFNEIGTIP